MKKIRLFLFLLLTVSVAFAQKEKTPKIEKAKILLDKGEVAEAKMIIDAATEHEKTMDKVKTWYYRGLIYESIYNSEDEAIKSLSDDAYNIAANSFLKVKEIEPEIINVIEFNNSIEKRLKLLKRLYDQGLINDEEYGKKRKEILNQI